MVPQGLLDLSMKTQQEASKVTPHDFLPEDWLALSQLPQQDFLNLSRKTQEDASKVSPHDFLPDDWLSLQQQGSLPA